MQPDSRDGDDDSGDDDEEEEEEEEDPSSGLTIADAIKRQQQIEEQKQQQQQQQLHKKKRFIATAATSAERAAAATGRQAQVYAAVTTTGVSGGLVQAGPSAATVSTAIAGVVGQQALPEGYAQIRLAPLRSVSSVPSLEAAGTRSMALPMFCISLHYLLLIRSAPYGGGHRVVLRRGRDPLRGPFGQMLDKEMSKTSRLHAAAAAPPTEEEDLQQEQRLPLHRPLHPLPQGTYFQFHQPSLRAAAQLPAAAVPAVSPAATASQRWIRPVLQEQSARKSVCVCGFSYCQLLLTALHCFSWKSYYWQLLIESPPQFQLEKLLLATWGLLAHC